MQKGFSLITQDFLIRCSVAQRVNEKAISSILPAAEPEHNRPIGVPREGGGGGGSGRCWGNNNYEVT